MSIKIKILDIQLNIDYITFYFGNYYKYERVYDMWLDLEKRFEILCIS